jgi:hypothetical protein
MKIYFYTTRILSKQNLSFNTIFLPCVLELKQRFNPCSVDGASLCFLCLKKYFYMCHIFSVFQIYHIVGFIIEWIWHRWFFKFSTTFAVFSHLPHCGVQYWIKMALVILQTFYNFRSFHKFALLWGSFIEWKKHWWFFKFSTLFAVSHIYRNVLNISCCMQCSYVLI